MFKVLKRQMREHRVRTTVSGGLLGCVLMAIGGWLHSSVFVLLGIVIGFGMLGWGIIETFRNFPPRLGTA